MRKAYSLQQKAECVALARIVGSTEAARQLGIDRRTVISWMHHAGGPPELLGDSATWTRLFDLAAAKVEKELTSGKLHPATAATIMGIAHRNRDNLRNRPAPPAPSAIAVRDAFYNWLIETALETDWDPAVHAEATSMASLRRSARDKMPSRLVSSGPPTLRIEPHATAASGTGKTALIARPSSPGSAATPRPLVLEPVNGGSATRLIARTRGGWLEPFARMVPIAGRVLAPIARLSDVLARVKAGRQG